MITLSKGKEVVINRNSSKGNQLKWKADEYWYKADYLGYEALAEYVVSSLLVKSTIGEFVRYGLEKISYNGFEFDGCSCKHFLKEHEILITLPRLFRLYLNEDIYMKCENVFWTEADCIKYVVDSVVKITRLVNFGEYLTMLLELDAFFLNEDRHFHNIAVIYNEETDKFRYCPVFDNGGALFSDMKMFYPLDKNEEACMKEITAKPFSPCFDDQVNAAVKLYGTQFDIWFTEEDLKECLGKVKDRYDERILNRVYKTLMMQMNKRKNTDMILRVFKESGMVLSKRQAYDKLKKLYQHEEFPSEKASECLSGATNAGTLVLENDIYKRVK